MENEKIPTFQELAEAKGWRSGDQLDIKAMAEIHIEITKMRIKAALKAAALKYENDELYESDSPEYLKQSILNAYSENLIQ